MLLWIRVSCTRWVLECAVVIGLPHLDFVGVRYWVQAETKDAMKFSRKTRGVAKMVTSPITMAEAVSAKNFIEFESAYGKQVLALWAMQSLTGRRAATLVAIQVWS